MLICIGKILNIIIVIIIIIIIITIIIIVITIISFLDVRVNTYPQRRTVVTHCPLCVSRYLIGLFADSKKTLINLNEI